MKIRLRQQMKKRAVIIRRIKLAFVANQHTAAGGKLARALVAFFVLLGSDEVEDFFGDVLRGFPATVVPAEGDGRQAAAACTAPGGKLKTDLRTLGIGFLIHARRPGFNAGGVAELQPAERQIGGVTGHVA